MKVLDFVQLGGPTLTIDSIIFEMWLVPVRDIRPAEAPSGVGSPLEHEGQHPLSTPG